MAGQSLAFGPFRLDADGVLWRDGRLVSIGRRGVRLLELLLRHRGQVVGKAELIDAAWPNEAVEESNLSVQIAQLRKRLGSEWIISVERVGYRLVEDPPVARPNAPSLVIRAFKNLGGVGDIPEALTEDVTTSLARFGSLRVMAATAGRAADYVLEGSVRREDGTLRITARLVEQRSGHYLWAHCIELAAVERPPVGLLTSMVEAQVELAEIAAARSDRSGDDAPALYRRAQWLMRSSLPEQYALATSLLERALAHDPDNIRYLGGLCEAIGHRISMGWPVLEGSDADRMHDAATHGLRQPKLDAEALAHFGFGLFRSGDPEGGYDLMRRAADLNPHNVTLACLAGQAAMNWGSLADAEVYYRKGLSLDPGHVSRGSIMGGLSRIRMAEGDFEGALLWADGARRVNPNYGGTHWTLISANAMLGRTAESGRLLDRFRSDHPGVTCDRIKTGQPARARLSSTLEGLDRAGMAARG